MNTFLQGRLALATCALLMAQAAVAAADPPGETGSAVVASGTVPDEAARAAILGKLRSIYGHQRVIDRLEVGGVIPPPGWTDRISAALDDTLRQVRDGRLEIDGTRVAISGTVANEAQRQALVSDIATALSPAYTVRSTLRVGNNAQASLDEVLARRIVEFRSGSATLTQQGVELLDELAGIIRTLDASRIQIIGHTDSSGERLANVALSLARADAVRTYLIRQGIAAERLGTLGAGPDRPLADNATEAGRARNRRIELRVVH